MLYECAASRGLNVLSSISEHSEPIANLLRRLPTKSVFGSERQKFALPWVLLFAYQKPTERTVERNIRRC